MTLPARPSRRLARLLVCGLACLGLAADAKKPPAVVAVDSAGAPVANSTVRLENGILSVSAPGFLTWSRPIQAQTSTRVQAILLRPAGLRGRLGSKGRGIEGGRIALRGGARREEFSGVSGKQGDYQFDNLAPGLYEIRCEEKNHIPFEEAVSLREGEARWLGLELRPAARLNIEAVSATTAEPVSSVELRILTEGKDGRFLPERERGRLAAMRAGTDERGHALIGPLGFGIRHRVRFGRTGYAAASIVLTPTEQVLTRRVILPPEGAIRGLFQDADRHPIAGVVAELRSDDAEDADLVPSPAPTGKDGILTAGALPPGTYALRVRAKGFRPRTLRGAEVRMGAVTDLGPVGLDPGLEVGGTVRGEGGKPLAGAVVRAWFFEEGRRLSAEDEADEAGGFRVSGLPEGEIAIEATATGYLPYREEIVPAGSHELDITLSRTGSIEGRVVEKGTNLPVTGFSIDLWPVGGRGGSPPGPSARRGVVFNDPDGRFLVEGLGPGEYTLKFKAAGYQSLTVDKVSSRAEERRPLEIALESGRAVRGIVRDSDSWAPVAGASIRAADLPVTKTDERGKFELLGCGDRVKLQIDHPQYIPETVEDAAPGDGRLIEVALRRGGSVEGHVYRSRQAPVPGAVVAVRLPVGERTGETGPDGHYRIDGLSAGRWTVFKVDVPGTYDGYQAAVVGVEEGLTVVQDFGSGTRLSGIVTHEGRPASDAVLALARIASRSVSGEPLLESHAARSREDGHYEFRGLDEGTYGLTVTWEGRKVGKQIAVNSGGEEQRLDVALRDLWLSGEVLDKETRSPLRGKVLVSQRAAGESMGLSLSRDGEDLQFETSPQSVAETDARGRFRALVMEPGAYTITALVRGYRLEKAVVLEIGYSRDDIDLSLSPALVLSVSASDGSTGQPIRETCTLLIDRESRSTTCGTAPGRFESLRPGSYLAAAWAPGYAVGHRTEALEGDSKEVTIPLEAGGTLRVFLPPGLSGTEAGVKKAGLRMFDSEGTEILDLIRSLHSDREPWFVAVESGTLLFSHVPSGAFGVSIGGEGTPLPLRNVPVRVDPGAETIVDFR